jgi:peptide-methionine (S)-S-oxide reductase
MKRSFPGAAVAFSVVAAAALLLATRPGGGRRGEAVALPAPATDVALAAHASEDTAVFAGGCFWGVEGVFEHVRGVKSAMSGYAGGHVPSPTYEQVSTGTTGHAEAVLVVYDPSQVTYGRLLEVFFAVAHDPTQLNRQGPDVGTQYRSALFYRGDAQKRAAEAYVSQLTRAKAFSRPIVTEIVPLRAFYLAEDYHQDYMAHHPNQPYIVMHDAPKLEHLRRQFPTLYREPAGR